MRAIKSTDTGPEVLLRRELWRRGMRYRLRRRVLGTRPDLTFVGSRVVVFVDGCFWHGCPEHYRPPVGNSGYWEEKLHSNVARDRRHDLVLRDAGWRVLRFWECEVERDTTAIADQIASETGQGRAGAT